MEFLPRQGKNSKKTSEGTFSGPSSGSRRVLGRARFQIKLRGFINYPPCVVKCSDIVLLWCRLRGVSLQWEASDNKQELDLRGSRLASFDETRQLWTQGKLNWTTAELSLKNATGGGGGRLAG